MALDLTLSLFRVSGHNPSDPLQNLHQHLLDFDATLGFPGEGPRFSLIGVVWILVVGFGFCHGMVPRNRDDEIRATRRTGKCLAEGRPVERPTKTNRKNCWRLLNFGHLKEVFRGKIFWKMRIGSRSTLCTSWCSMAGSSLLAADCTTTM